MVSDSKVVKSLFKGGSIIFAGLIFAKVMGLVYRVIVGRFMGPEVYGIISVMIAVFSVAAAFAYIGIPAGVQRYIADFRGEKNLYKQVGAARIGLIMVTISSTITGVALFLLAPYLATEIFNEPRTLWPIRFVAIILPLRGFRKVFISVTEAFEKMQYKVYTLYIYANLAKVLLTLLVIALGYGYLQIAGAFAFAYGTAFILAGIFAYKLLPEMFNLNFKGDYIPKKMFNHSWPLFAAGLLTTIAGYIDTFMLQAFLGSEEVGLYNAAYPFAALITFGSSIFGSIYLSNASKLYGQEKYNEMSSAYRLIVKWITMLTIPVFAAIMLFPSELLQIFGNEYLEMDQVLRVLAIGFLASALIGPVSKTLQAIDKTKIKFYITIFTAVTNIALNFILIKTFGILGAAYATAATFILAFILKFAVIKYYTGHQPFRMTTLKAIISGLAASAIIIPITTLLDQIPHIIIPLALTIFLTSYILLILLTKTLEKEDITILKQIKEHTGLESKKIQKIIEKHSQN